MDDVNATSVAGLPIANTLDRHCGHLQIGPFPAAGGAPQGREPGNSQAARSVLFTMSLFDRLSTPLFMVTRTSTVVWANAGCRRFFAQSGQLVLQGDRARAGSPRQRAALEAFLEGRPECTPRLQPDVFVLEQPSGADGALLVRLSQPFALQDDSWASSSGDASGTILGIIDPTTGTAKPNVLARHLYGLTDAEHELCVALTAGRRLKDWARLRRVTINTARAQMKSVLAKMGVPKQQDVVRIWLSLSAIDCSAIAEGLTGHSNAPAKSIGARSDRTAMPADLRMPRNARPQPVKATINPIA